MARRKKIKIFIVIVFCVVFIGGLFLCQSRSMRRFTACAISVTSQSMLLRLDIPTDKLVFGSVYFVRTANAEFVSHDSSIKNINDLKPGTLVKVTFENFDTYCESIAPNIPYMTTATKIVTDGKTDDALLQVGIDDLYELGFSYENGEVSSRLRFSFSGYEST